MEELFTFSGMKFFSIYGLIALLLAFIPNIVFEKKKHQAKLCGMRDGDDFSTAYGGRHAVHSNAAAGYFLRDFGSSLSFVILPRVDSLL